MAREILKLFITLVVAAFFFVRYHVYYFFRNIMFWRKHIMRTPIAKGLRLYQFDPKTLELTREEPVATKGSVMIKRKKYMIQDFKIKRGCTAITALNDKNAIKHARKNLKQRGYEQPEYEPITIRTMSPGADTQAAKIL